MTPESTLPKPFVFVLIPFDKAFDDIYKFGIKGAADDVGAYAEKLDEQIFSEGMLDRIFNQISKADVVVADMTGKNANVFYEVGYAHALGKIVILLTKNSDDIPFDLKHRRHIVYSGSIDTLRQELAITLQWAISESSKKKQKPENTELFSLRIFATPVPRVGQREQAPVVAELMGSGREFFLPIQLRNDSIETTSEITHVYLFSKSNSFIVPVEKNMTYVDNMNPVKQLAAGSTPFFYTYEQTQPLPGFAASPIDSQDGLDMQYRLRLTFPALPPGAVEIAIIHLMSTGEHDTTDAVFRIRLHSSSQYHDYPFRLKVQYQKPSAKEDVFNLNAESDSEIKT